MFKKLSLFISLVFVFISSPLYSDVLISIVGSETPGSKDVTFNFGTGLGTYTSKAGGSQTGDGSLAWAGASSGGVTSVTAVQTNALTGTITNLTGGLFRVWRDKNNPSPHVVGFGYTNVGTGNTFTVTGGSITFTIVDSSSIPSSTITSFDYGSATAGSSSYNLVPVPEASHYTILFSALLIPIFMLRRRAQLDN